MGDVTSLQFSRLGHEHAGVVATLERQCFSLPWSEAQCRAAFTQPAFAAFGLFRAAELVAYISVYHTPDELEILNLAVKLGERRLGMGRRVLTMALQVARKMGIQRVLLEVREGNQAARSLYEDCGFTQTGVRPRYYHNSGENALTYLYTL